MTKFDADEAGMKAFLEHIGARVRVAVDETVAESAEEDLEVAVDLLHRRLNEIAGLEFDRAWAQQAVETLRRGEQLEIQIG
ncbi:MAG: hypothetical protein ABIN79_06570 [Marmoricola sp.]